VQRCPGAEVPRCGGEIVSGCVSSSPLPPLPLPLCFFLLLELPCSWSSLCPRVPVSARLLSPLPLCPASARPRVPMSFSVTLSRTHASLFPTLTPSLFVIASDGALAYEDPESWYYTAPLSKAFQHGVIAQFSYSF
jgi:hypothetical protein